MGTAGNKEGALPGRLKSLPISEQEPLSIGLCHTGEKANERIAGTMKVDVARHLRARRDK